MHKRNAYTLIQVGLWIRHLQNAATLKLGSVRKGIGILDRELKESAFDVSGVAAGGLSDFLTALKSLPDQELLGVTRANDLRRTVASLEDTIFAEAQTKHYYVVTPRRYNSRYLLDQPGQLFREEVFKRMPTLSQYDFEHGFRSLAFELPTAAAFHILRATEGLLKECYLSRIKRKRLKNPMWAGMLLQLQQLKTNRWPEPLLEALNNIRKSYRNPTSHPEATFTMDEAQDLLGLCIDVVNKLDVLKE